MHKRAIIAGKFHGPRKAHRAFQPADGGGGIPIA